MPRKKTRIFGSMRKSLAVILMACLLLTTLPVGAAFADSPASVVAGSVSGEPGQSVNVEIRVNNPSGMANYQFVLAYDPSVAVATAVTSGVIPVTKNLTTASNGSISLSAATDTGIFTSSESLMTVTFLIQPQATGSSILEVRNLLIGDVNAQAIASTSTSGTITVTDNRPTIAIATNGVTLPGGGTIIPTAFGYKSNSTTVNVNGTYQLKGGATLQGVYRLVNSDIPAGPISSADLTPARQINATGGAFSTALALSTINEGHNSIVFAIKDSAGRINISEYLSIIVDNQGPTGVLSINGGATSTSLASVNFSVTSFPQDTRQIRYAASQTALTSALWQDLTTDGIYPFTLTGAYGTKTIYAQLKDDVWNAGTSFSSSIEYTQMPVVSADLTPGVYYTGKTIVLTSSDPAAPIKYTTDAANNDPGTWTTYANPISITANTTIKAVTVVESAYSSQQTFAYEIKSVPAVTISLNEGNYRTPQTITLGPATIPIANNPNAPSTIYYTLDGSDPTQSNNNARVQYTTPIQLPSGNKTLKAVLHVDDRCGALAVRNYSLNLATYEMVRDRFSTLNKLLSLSNDDIWFIFDIASRAAALQTLSAEELQKLTTEGLYLANTADTAPLMQGVIGSLYGQMNTPEELDALRLYVSNTNYPGLVSFVEAIKTAMPAQFKSALQTHGLTEDQIVGTFLDLLGIKVDWLSINQELKDKVDVVLTNNGIYAKISKETLSSWGFNWDNAQQFLNTLLPEEKDRIKLIAEKMGSVVLMPQADIASGTYYHPITVALSALDPSGTILYTLNGDDPKTAGTIYTAPINISSTKTLKAVRRVTGDGVTPYFYSDVVTYNYTITITVAPPTASKASGFYTAPISVTLNIPQGAKVYYTLNNTVPTTSSSSYTANQQIAINTSTKLKAIATDPSGTVLSSVASFDYNIMAVPTSDLAPGIYPTTKVANLATTTWNATIYYTTDGSDPDNSSKNYITNPWVIAARSQITLKAVTGFNDGGTMKYSGLAQWSYEALAQPLANPGPVSGMVAPQPITLSANVGADIYYTLDGSEPNPANIAQKYTAPIVLNNSATIKAITVKGGVSTAIKTYTYNLVVKGTVSGTVSSLDGPLVGVRVNLTNANGDVLTSTVTGPGGSYQFNWIPGTYKVVVPMSMGYTSAAQDVTITAGGTATANLIAYLGGTVTGRITDGTTGIPDITVSISSEAGWADAITDAQGNFRLVGLGTSTEYVLSINDYRFVPDNEKFVPETQEDVAVTAGQLTSLGNIALESVSTTLGSINVDVQTDTTPAEAINDAYVMAYSDDGGNGNGYGVTVDGTVTISNLPAGSYSLIIFLSDGRVEEVAEQVVTAQQTKEVTVNFAAPRSISGIVKDNSNNPLAGVRVYVSNGGQYSEDTTDAQGAYTLENLGAYSYTVIAEPTDKNYVNTSSTTAANTANGNVTNFNLTLKSAGTVSGTVTSTAGVGIPNLRVSVGDWSNRTTTDADGEFTVRGLQNGTYDVNIYDASGTYMSYMSKVTVNIDGTAQDRNKDIGVISLKTVNEDAEVFVNVNNVITNSVTLDTQMPIPGGNVRYQINLKNTTADLTAENAVLKINVPSGSKYIGGILGTYTTNVNPQGIITNGEITVNLGNVAPGVSKRLFVQLQLPEDLAGALVAGAKIAYTLDNGATNKVEAIGLSAVEMKFITLEGPNAALPTQEVIFHGKASAGADITIRAKEANGATEVILGRGIQDGKWWSSKVKFLQAGTWTVWAYNTASGKTVKSEPIIVKVNANVPVIDWVTVNAGWNPEFTVDPSKHIPSIAVSENYGMQFEVKFKKDDAKVGADRPTDVTMSFQTTDNGIPYALNITPVNDYTFQGVLNGPWSGNGERQVKVSYKAVGDAATTYTTALVEILILIDPSGYVTDAISGAALPGTKAVAQKLDENTNQWYDWDAARYGQVNPQVTDATGHYGWDVPEGRYRVVFSMTGYVSYTSEIVIVPPPKTDLNVGMVPTASQTSPAVVAHTPSANDVSVAVDSNITATFSKEMAANTLAGTNNITVSAGGLPVNGVITYDAVLKTATFNPTADLQNGTTYTVTVNTNAKDTFNNSLPSSVVWTFTTVDAITVSSVAVPLDNYRVGSDVSITGQLFINGDPAPLGSALTVTITPAVGIAANINATTGADGVYTVTYTTDAVAENTFTVTGSSGGSDTFNTVIVANPQADKATGSYVSTVTVALTSTAGADIYYTLNGTDPDPTDAAQRYTGAITITSNKTLKAVAVKHGVSSDIVSYSYTITQPSGGGGGIVTPVLTTVTVSGSIPSLPVGQTFDLSTLTVSGKDQNGNAISITGKTITWASSNSAVASVSGTTLTAAAAGTAQVTATVDGKTSNSLSVTVTTTKTDTTVVDASNVDAQIAAGSAEVKVSAPVGAKQPAVDITGAVLQKLTTSSKPLVVQLGDTTVKVAPGAITASSNDAVVTLSATAVPDNQAAELVKKAGSAFKLNGKIVEIKAEEVTGNQTKSATVTGELQITLPYSEGANADLLDIYWYNPTTGQWEAQRASIDRVKKTITATVNHLSTWAVMESHKTFEDVKGHWAQAEVEYMASKNVVNGFVGNVFNPEANVTRAQYAAFLVRALNLKYDASMTNGFKDVGVGMTLYQEIVTAASLGLVNGYSKDEFRPNEAISRQQMAVLVARALVKVAGVQALSAAQVNTILAPFKDSGDISPNLRSDVALAVQEGISNGMAKDRFAPAATATRAQAAVMLKRMLDNLAK